ncbi:MAG: Type 1 glutamine amidotransferase-like domain-containing protein [archaeon]
MARVLYLMSGHTSTGRLKDLDSRALNDAEGGNVLVLNLSYDNKAKNQEKGDFFANYFQEIGADSISMVEQETPEGEIREGLERANLLYLPGGDTKKLIHNLKSKGLDAALRIFKGVISGNSAGAYALCPEYLRIGRGDAEIIPSLGIVDFWMKAHYESKFDSDLELLSRERLIYALENESALVFEKRISFIGNVWRFLDGKKERVN